jgi:hypothetical protein
MHTCIYILKKDRPKTMRNLKDTYMKIRRQFSQVLKTPSWEKRSGARS